MKKTLAILILPILVSCSPKPTPESEALLQEIHSTQSKTKVGISYVDYSRVAQELQVRLDNFKRSRKSTKIKYAGNLVLIAESYIEAAYKKYDEDWSPQSDWERARWGYEYLQSCQTKDDDCYGFKEQTQLALNLSERSLAELNEYLKSLNSSKD